MKTTSIALEAYRADHGWYPHPVPSDDGWTRLPQLIIGEKERRPSDPEHLPFIGDGKSLGYALVSDTSEQWAPLLEGLEPRPAFILLSPGPKKETSAFRLNINMVYDPTNGTMSEGYMFLFGGEAKVLEPVRTSSFTYDPTNGTSSRAGPYRVKP